jgi:hypothetical protein
LGKQTLLTDLADYSCDDVSHLVAPSQLEQREIA